MRIDHQRMQFPGIVIDESDADPADDLAAVERRKGIAILVIELGDFLDSFFRRVGGFHMGEGAMKNISGLFALAGVEGFERNNLDHGDESPMMRGAWRRPNV